MSLHNTNMKRELEHMGMMLSLARDYGRKIGFKGTFLVEPKPMEPSKHQYDFDVATIIGFLRQHGLDKDFKLNIEVNHATLAGIRSSMNFRSLLMPDFLEALMPIKAITRTAGILMSSRQIFMRLQKP